ncbi:MAG: septal ring lytic transglycosylase RlpA family protein [Verrucomicrobiota bacterium]
MKSRFFPLLFLFSLANCSTVPQELVPVPVIELPVAPVVQKPSVTATYHGKASWYSIKTNRGTQTASGERLSNSAMTAAHKKLKMGTKIRVTNKRNGRSVVVRINDRGPYIKGRIIDVTIGAARKLGMVEAGVVPVKVEVLAK